jgi:hypothetical protein
VEIGGVARAARLALGSLIQRFPNLSLAVPRAELRWKAS